MAQVHDLSFQFLRHLTGTRGHCCGRACAAVELHTLRQGLASSEDIRGDLEVAPLRLTGKLHACMKVHGFVPMNAPI
jgi:hypothetical protein